MGLIDKFKVWWKNRERKAIDKSEIDIAIEKAEELINNIKYDETDRVTEEIREEIIKAVSSVKYKKDLSKEQQDKLIELDRKYSIGTDSVLGSLYNPTRYENINNSNKYNDAKSFREQMVRDNVQPNPIEENRETVPISSALHQIDDLITQIYFSKKAFYNDDNLKESVKDKFEQLFDDIDKQYTQLTPEQYAQKKDLMIEYHNLDSSFTMNLEDIHRYIEVLSNARSEKVELYRRNMKNQEERQ